MKDTPAMVDKLLGAGAANNLTTNNTGSQVAPAPSNPSPIAQQNPTPQQTANVPINPPAGAPQGSVRNLI